MSAAMLGAVTGHLRGPTIWLAPRPSLAFNADTYLGWRGLDDIQSVTGEAAGGGRGHAELSFEQGAMGPPRLLAAPASLLAPQLFVDC